MNEGARHDEVQCNDCGKYISEKSMDQHVVQAHDPAMNGILSELGKEGQAKRFRTMTSPLTKGTKFRKLRKLYGNQLG